MIFRAILNGTELTGRNIMLAPSNDLCANEKPCSKETVILIVDDQELNLRILDAYLRRLKVKTICANNAMTALEFLCQYHPDAVLTDILMPQMDGLKLAAEIRSMEGFKKIPIYGITAALNTVTETERYHFDGILMKPVTTEKLQNILDAVIKKNV